MGKSNGQVAHDFYYRGVNDGKRGNYSGCTISYDGNDCYSYSTIVAKVIPTEDGHFPCTAIPESGITLVSFDSMSTTTGRHVSDIMGASPFRTVHVPMRYGSRYLEPRDLAFNFNERLSSVAGHLNRAEYRRQFAELIESLVCIRDNAVDAWAKPLRDSGFDRFLKMDVAKMAKELHERKRAETVRKARETREVFRKYLKDRHGQDYLDFVEALFGFHDSSRSESYPLTHDEIVKLRTKFDSSKAYVWIEDDYVVTSKDVRVPIREAKIAMTAWAHGHDMRKFTVGRYTVIRYEGDEIQIGCHHIPRENMLALYEVVMGRPFEITNKEEN